MTVMKRNIKEMQEHFFGGGGETLDDGIVQALEGVDAEVFALILTLLTKARDQAFDEMREIHEP